MDMAFGGFKETNETKENTDNKESFIENSEKKRNQILEVPEDYDDDFDSKIDSNEKKEEDNSSENEKKSDGNEKQGLFSHIKGLFSKDKPNEGEKQKETEEENTEPEKSRSESFRDSMKVERSPEEIKKYNAEHGYSDEVKERPKGGVERERTLEKEDPRWADTQDDLKENSKDNAENQ